MIKKWMYTFIVMLLCACGANEDEFPGVCTLDCSSPVIAGGSDVYKFEPVGTPATKFTCASGAAGADAPAPVTYQFRLVKNSGGYKYEDGKIKSTGGGGDAAAAADNGAVSGIPIGGVSVNVQTGGGIFSTNSEDGIRNKVAKEVNNTLVPAEYVGIGTAKEEWCTDSCGVFKVQLWLTCPVEGTSPGYFTLSSGAVGTTVQLEVTTQEAGAALVGQKLWEQETNFDPVD